MGTVSAEIPGLMQKKQFNVINVLQHAALWHADVEVVTNSVEGGIHRIGYAKLYDRTSQLANALNTSGRKNLGIV